MVSSTPRPHFTPGKEPVPILQEAGWAPWAVLDGRKISSPPGFDPARPASSQSLYRLSYRVHERLIYSSSKYINLSPLVYTLALYSSSESEYSNFLLVFHMWPLSTNMISVSYCCSYIRPIVYVPYATEFDDKVGNSVALLLGFPVFEVQPGDHVHC